MMLTNLADILRAAGLKVQEVPGWKTRGHGQMQSIEGILCHHTAGPKTGNYPSLPTVRDGRTGLKGPLAQLGLARDGTWLTIAAGLCWHAGVVFYDWQTNPHSIGVEAEATGTAPWPKVQYDSYVAGVAALRKAFSLPLDHVVGHKEAAKPRGRKPDPNFDMAAFRVAVGKLQSKPTTPPAGDDDMALTGDDLNKIYDKAYAANAQYARDFWVAPTGTGTALLALTREMKLQLDRIEDDTDALQASRALVAKLDANVQTMAQDATS